MVFSSRVRKIDIGPSETRVVLVIGGSGMLGRAFAKEAPDDTFVVNVSRAGQLEGVRTANIEFDVRRDIAILAALLQESLPRVDVLINMAYTKTFSSIKNFKRQRFLDELDVDVAVPIATSLACAGIFWSNCLPAENRVLCRKVIQVSSLAAHGKTQRPELATYSAAKSALTIITPYLHDYLYDAYGVAAHVLAPGSLTNAKTLEESVRALWMLVDKESDVSLCVKVS